MKKILYIMLLGQSVLFAAAPPAPGASSPFKKGGISTVFTEAVKVGEYQNPKESTATSNYHLRQVVERVEEDPKQALKGGCVKATAWAALGCSPARGSKHVAARVKRVGSDYHHHLRNQRLDDAKKTVQDAAERDVKSRIKKDTFSDRCESARCGRKFSERAPGWVTLRHGEIVRLHKACADRLRLPVICSATVADFDLFPETPVVPKTPSPLKSPVPKRRAALVARAKHWDSKEADKELKRLLFLAQ